MLIFACDLCLHPLFTPFRPHAHIKLGKVIILPPATLCLRHILVC
ncbi:hypothetical protein [Helicobacter fennelliae]